MSPEKYHRYLLYHMGTQEVHTNYKIYLEKKAKERVELAQKFIAWELVEHGCKCTGLKK